MRKCLKLVLLLIIGCTPLFAKVPAKRGTVVYTKNNRGNLGNYYRNTRHWPSYYSYYGYPIVASPYYYSFPMNNNFFDSYPSYFTDWTYPSYPYVGKYYINDAPVSASKFHAQKRYRRGIFRPSGTSSSVIISSPQEGKTGGVFIND